MIVFCFIFQGGRKSLADKFEYVMHGKLYKISEEGSGANVKVYVLFRKQFLSIFFIAINTGFNRMLRK